MSERSAAMRWAAKVLQKEIYLNPPERPLWQETANEIIMHLIDDAKALEQQDKKLRERYGL